MRNTTLNNKTLGITLFAGAFALAVMASAQAQVLGGGALPGGITGGGGLAGSLNSTMGQMGGRFDGAARGMGNLHAPDINQRAAARRAVRLHQRATSTAASATGTAERTTRQLNGQAAADATAGLTGAVGADTRNGNQTAALGGVAGMGTSAAGGIDSSSARNAAVGTAGQAAGHARSAVSTAKRGSGEELGRVQDAAGSASANTEGSATAGLSAVRQITATGAQPAHAVGSLGTDATGNVSQAGSNTTSNQSGTETAPHPGLLSQTSSAMRGAGNRTIDVSGSGAAHGNTNAKAGSPSGTRGSASANGQAGARAGAHGSARDGISTSVQPGVNAGASAQQH
jgi:hypothetical protein